MALSFIRTLFIACELNLARLKYFYVAALVAFALLAGAFWGAFLRAPAAFPANSLISIPAGESVSKAGLELKNEHVIDSAFLFKALVRITPRVRGIRSGTYLFKEPVGVLVVAWNLSHGVSGLTAIRLTFPEGTPSRQMGALLAKQLPDFSEQKFDALAAPYEGMLFPDTYFFMPGSTEQDVVERLHANYESHIAKFSAQIDASGHSERDIVTMASLLEGEGKSLVDRRVIAGILWRRLAIGMPLQVDAAFGYALGKTGYVPTITDLSTDSSYNTYRRKGLPPTPIDNPGDESILAALTPTKTGYLYYLTGTDGKMHYAKTLAEHIANQNAYLSK